MDIASIDIKLVAVDLDGTLLNSQKQITPESVEVLREVRRERKVSIVLSTARPPRSSMPFYRQLGLNDPMINYNGALLWQPSSGRVIFHQPIPYGVARGLVRWAKERFPGKVYLSANIGDKWYTDFRDQSRNFEAVKADMPDLIAPYQKWLTQGPTKLMLLGDPAALDEVEQAIKADLAEQIRPYRANKKMLQIMHKAASKRDALKRLTDAAGLGPQNVIAIGDNVNDAGMIHWAGVGVSVANGHVICLQVADHVTDHCDDDGVAHILRRIVLEGKLPDLV
jgi:hypothetical protein